MTAPDSGAGTDADAGDAGASGAGGTGASGEADLVASGEADLVAVSEADTGAAAGEPPPAEPGVRAESGAPVPDAGHAGGAVLPEQSREDTDAAWGEYPESADDRLYRDRPPHWDNY